MEVRRRTEHCANLRHRLNVGGIHLAELRDVVQNRVQVVLHPRLFLRGQLQICQLGDTPISLLSHEQFKAATRGARAIVRTGEFSPYANVILRAGVVF